MWFIVFGYWIRWSWFSVRINRILCDFLVQLQATIYCKSADMILFFWTNDYDGLIVAQIIKKKYKYTDSLTEHLAPRWKSQKNSKQMLMLKTFHSHSNEIGKSKIITLNINEIPISFRDNKTTKTNSFFILSFELSTNSKRKRERKKTN